MMDDIEKTKPVAEAPADDDETGAGCDVCMPPIALVGADKYDYKYLCMPSMVRHSVRTAFTSRRWRPLRAIDARPPLRRERPSTRHIDGVTGHEYPELHAIDATPKRSRGARAASSRRSSSPRTRSCP